MKLLRLALRLACLSALTMLGATAISVMTHDAWLRVGHAAGVLSAVIAAGAVLILGVAGLRALAGGLPRREASEPVLEPYELGLTGLEAAADPAWSSRADGASTPPPAS